jgi:hypothetical protein
MADTPTEAAEALTQVAAAVSGPDTPNRATVASTPSKGTAITMILAGPAISGGIVGLVWLLSFHHWPDVMAVKEYKLAGKILDALTLLCTILAVLLGVVIFRLASGGLKSITAKALSGSIEVRTGDRD